MSGRLPALKARKVLRGLERLGVNTRLNARHRKFVALLVATVAAVAGLDCHSSTAHRTRADNTDAQKREIGRTLFVPDPLPPLDAEVHSRFEPAPGVTAERISYTTQSGMRVPAILYLPKPLPKRKIPALIVVNGHGGDKYSWYAFYSGILYARGGAAVLTYDPIGEGERNAERKSGTRAHDRVIPPPEGPEVARRLAGLMITDVRQAVSLLAQRPEVDARRIGAMGYSMGSFVLSLACAIETRLRACVLVGGGNLDEPGGYWDKSKPMCQGIPYQSLGFLGDRAAVLYALHAERGATLIYNGLEDTVVAIPRHGKPFFDDLRRRLIALRGGDRGVFETGFQAEISHRPFFVTRPVALWLEKQLDFSNWTERAIRAMPETRIGDWARRNSVEMDPGYASDDREGGTPALGSGVPGLRREQLTVFSPEGWAQNRERLVYESWLARATQAPLANSTRVPSRDHQGAVPARYFHLLEAGIRPVREFLAANPNATLESLEKRAGWRHFPSAVLVAAVLYNKQNNAEMLALSTRVGDLLAREHNAGRYNTRLDHHRDTYMWLDAYRLLEPKLDAARRDSWRKALMDLASALAKDVARRKDYPVYASPFIGTSPNHYSLWSSTLHLAGKVFGNAEWERLGAAVMHRFAAEEQAPDGYWGEHSRAGPTTGYDYLTATGVALYYEHSRDPAALDALRRSVDFHKHYTYPDGVPAEIFDDRRRHVYISPWAHFGFSHFPDGRRFAEFLTSFYEEGRLGLEHLGRLAQNALYFHPGQTAPIPQDLERHSHQMSVPAGIRKSGDWVVALSGIIATQAPLNRFYLDRQGHIGVFHRKTGVIISGANSKRQPELATFSERADGQVYYLPVSSRLGMNDAGDRLALAYNTFFAVLNVPPPSREAVDLRFAITPRSRAMDATLTLQLVLKPGAEIETAAGRKLVLSDRPIRLASEEIGGWIHHNGWSLGVPAGASLSWPVFPYNPYANAPETELRYAVGALAMPLPKTEQEVTFRLRVLK